MPFLALTSKKREVVNVAHAFLMPLDTSSGHLTPEQILGAEQRLQRLLHSFEMTCQDELARLREEGNTLKQQMAHTIAVADKNWKKVELCRQDKFVEMPAACQKEVAVMNAELRSGPLSCLQGNPISALLEQALQAKMDELRVLQGELDEMTASRMNTFTDHQKLLQEEREQHRERFLALQEETTRTIHELTLNIERLRHQHLRETRELQRQHAAQVHDLERQLQGEREAHANDAQRHTEVMVQFRATLRKLEEEKKQLTQDLTKQQLHAEEWRRRYIERDSQARLE
ncbi:hypothetical protein TraAM80_07991 [Trypanosoma rangeli]|uniref:Uncharacterized protein n=1 Tax=Trypanosoma rangeli TaxID=5698 RepID=A0A3R7KRB7_TRYRA|nr:uncharacterized protein TraAM80_07991 [Trypanosoma rangeli]RNE99799.1 hypothetical protein TraAM80_07991 [Trypanosoma rangeli]|eukprot:RNE99799.1 hypothetical protein TraAM80_07991 [Trypanosoma rangeli]